MRDFLSTPFLGNTAQDWMIALAVALVVMALVRVAIRLILRRLITYPGQVQAKNPILTCPLYFYSNYLLDNLNLLVYNLM